MTQTNDWVDPAALQQPVVVGPGRIDAAGWASTGRVGRDSLIGSVVVGAALEMAKSQGWGVAETISGSPNLLIVATGVVTVAVRFVVKWLGRYTA